MFSSFFHFGLYSTSRISYIAVPYFFLLKGSYTLVIWGIFISFVINISDVIILMYSFLFLIRLFFRFFNYIYLSPHTYPTNSIMRFSFSWLFVRNRVRLLIRAIYCF